MEYVQFTVLLTVKATDEDEVREEINEALDLIEADHLVYNDSVEVETVGAPLDAEDDDEEEDDD